jgi:hypothetical protein
MNNVFLWASGSDPEIIKRCPRHEYIKQGQYGALVFVPAILGFIGMSFAILTITESKYPKYCVTISLLGGVFWSVIVLVFDRFIVSTFRKSNSIWKDIFSIVFISRIIFAFFVGLVVAHPLVMLFFNESIDGAFKEIAINTINKEKESVENKIKNKQDEISIKEKIYNDEISGYNGAHQGVGDIAKEKKQLLFDAKTELNILKAKQIALNNKIEIFCKSFPYNLPDSLKQYNLSKDYIARENALETLKNKDKTQNYLFPFTNYRLLSISYPVSRTENFIIIFFVFIDILPATWKVISKRGVYDEYLESSEQLIKNSEELNRLISDMDKAVSTVIVDEKSKAEKDWAIKIFSDFTNQKSSSKKINTEIASIIDTPPKPGDETGRIEGTPGTNLPEFEFISKQDENKKPLLFPESLILSILALSFSLFMFFYINHAFDKSLKNSTDIVKTDTASKEIKDELFKINNSIGRRRFDEVSIGYIENEINSLIDSGKFKPPYPEYYSIINFIDRPSSTDGLTAAGIDEAWLMAYINIHQADFKYKNNIIDTYKQRESRRDAIIHLVKEETVNGIIKKMKTIY